MEWGSDFLNKWIEQGTQRLIDFTRLEGMSILMITIPFA
ncbi:hypothetical protein SAMN04488542_101180 [Fontibacillus panacisegetis]|uniref:Uncharacterized protein n=1 Tax=Fontibacillus panacisegetis TaxID=670482 RepID=A0A1G7EF02_9BACL|nr:hypothetical protein SAMN04488542_101180 [Fontibacillus panacisegetis]